MNDMSKITEYIRPARKSHVHLANVASRIFQLIFASYISKHKIRKQLLDECVNFCIEHEYCIDQCILMSDEFVFQGFQKLLDAGVLFKIEDYYTIIGAALIRNNIIKMPSTIIRDEMGRIVREKDIRGE